MHNIIRAIITGTTGMVGEGVLHECLLHPQVEAVVVINRKPCGIKHPKLKEIIHSDFLNLTAIKNELISYNTCFFCLGISSLAVTKEDYFEITHNLTIHFAETILSVNTGVEFCYVSGAGTDKTEKSLINWARVKGKTENDLVKLPFQKVYNFRPGFIKPTPGLNFSHKAYKYILWLFPLGRAIYPGGFCTLKEVGLAMINVVTKGYPLNILEGKDIIEVAKVK